MKIKLYLKKTTAALIALILCAALVACVDRGAGNETETTADTNDKTTEASPDETTSLPETDDSGDAEQVKAALTALRELDGATYLEAKLTIGTKMSGGGSNMNLSQTMDIMYGYDSAGAFLISVSDPESISYEVFSAGGKDYYIRESFAGVGDSVKHGASNIDLNFETFMSTQSGLGDFSSDMQLAPGSFEDLGELEEILGKAEQALVTKLEDGVLVEFTLDGDKLEDLIGEELTSEELGDVDGSVLFGVEVSDDGSLRGFNVSVTMEADGAKTEFTVKYTFDKISTGVDIAAPEWAGEAEALEVSEYLYVTDGYAAKYTFSEDTEGEASLEGIVLLSDKQLDKFEIPEQIEEKTVTYVDWFIFDGVVAPDGYVMIPDGVDCTDFYGDFVECSFFANIERPEELYADNIYFGGEWEMRDGVPTPTREPIDDHYDDDFGDIDDDWSDFDF